LVHFNLSVKCDFHWLGFELISVNNVACIMVWSFGVSENSNYDFV